MYVVYLGVVLSKSLVSKYFHMAGVEGNKIATEVYSKLKKEIHYYLHRGTRHLT